MGTTFGEELWSGTRLGTEVVICSRGSSLVPVPQLRGSRGKTLSFGSVVPPILEGTNKPVICTDKNFVKQQDKNINKE